MFRPTTESCGRYPTKPVKEKKPGEISEEETIDDQIENLRAKISVKERYNKAIKDDKDENEKGAMSQVHELYAETEALRKEFIVAIFAERTAVKKALLTHRNFQLSIRGTNAEHAIAWLDDKVFDLSKQLNLLIEQLALKRKMLQDSEDMVVIIEKYRKPGSHPHEKATVRNMAEIESLAAVMKVKCEAVTVLSYKYKEIRRMLKEESGSYDPALRYLENQLNIHKADLLSTEKMVKDADRLQKDSAGKLCLLQKQVKENRKRRRDQIAKMKQAVQLILQANSAAHFHEKEKRVSFDFLKEQKTIENLQIVERIQLMHEEVKGLRIQSEKLIETMRVTDLTLVPKRLKTMLTYAARLEIEQETKEEYRDLLLKHRDHLSKILYFFKYTGLPKDVAYHKSLAQSKEDIEDVDEEIEEVAREVGKVGESLIFVKMGVVSILSKLDEPKRDRRSKAYEMDTEIQFSIIASKIQVIKKRIKYLKGLFANTSASQHRLHQQHYHHATNLTVPDRLVRIGADVYTDNESDRDEDDSSDHKVPTRLDIKAKSKKFVQHACMKKGC